MSRRTARKRWLERMVWAMVVVLLAPVCAGYVTLQTSWGRERMQQTAVEALREELGLRAELGQVELSTELLPPGVVLTARDIVLDDPAYGRFAEAERLTIRPSLGALLRGEVDLHSIEIDAPTVHLLVRDGEVRNLPRPRNEVEGPAELPFGALHVHRAELQVDAEPWGTASIEQLELAIDVTDGDVLDVRAESSRGEIAHSEGTEPLQRLILDGRLELGRELSLKRLVVRTPHLRVEARDAFAPLPPEQGWRGELALKAHLTHLSRLPLGLELPPIHGWLEAEGQVEHAAQGAKGRASLKLTDLEVDGRGIGERVALDVGFDPEAIRIEDGELHVAHGGGRAALAGRIELEPGLPIELEAELQGLELDRLMAQLAVSDDAIVSWRIDGSVDLEGTLAPFVLRGPTKLDTRGFRVTVEPWHASKRQRVLGVERATLRTHMAVDADALRFERVHAETPRSELQGDVRLGFDDQLDVDVRIDPLDLADISPLSQFPIGGKGSAHVGVHGVYSDPELTGHLTLGGFSFDGFRAGNIETDVELEKGGLAARFPAVEAVKNDSRYRVHDLLLDWTRDRFEATATVHADRLALADIYHVFRYEEDERFQAYQGTARGVLDIRYTLDFPQDGPHGTLRLGFDLDLPELALHDYSFHDGRLVGRWRWLDYERGLEGGELTVEHLTLRKGEGTVSLSGRMKRGAELQMTATADQIAIRDTEGLGDRMPALRGSYGVVARIGGTASVPRVHLDVGMTGLSWQETLLGDARLYVRMTDRRDPWVLQARDWDPGAPPEGEPCARARAGLANADWPPDPPVQTVDGPEPALDRPMAYLVCGEALDGQVKLDLALGRTEPIPLRGLVELADLDLDPWLPQAQGDEHLAGTASGRITLRGGALKVPETLVADVDFSQLRVGTEDVELRGDGPLELEVERGAFRVHRAVFAGPGSALRISGGGSLQRGLALELAGDVDLGLAATLSPRVQQAEGRVGLEVKLSGPISDPAVYGEATVADAGFLFAGFPEPIEELGGQVTFSARRILFEDFRASVAGGTIGVSGAATLRGQSLQQYHFDIASRGLSLRPVDGVELGFGGDLRLAWQRGERLPKATGELRVEHAVYTRPIELSWTIGELYRPDRAEVERYDPDEDQLALDIRVVDKVPIRVDNNLIDADIRIEDGKRPFRIVGTDQRFGVLGTLAIPRGTVRFRGSDFDVRRGVIKFDDPSRVDPEFDVKAVSEIRRSGEATSRNWRITLHAHGNRDAFQLDASSQPHLSQEDLMLLLTVGMTRTEAEDLQAGDFGGAAVEALASVTGVDREVKRRLPAIDDFSITSRYSRSTNRAEPHVTVGKRIADRVRLSASTALSSESREFRTGLEWQVGDQTSVQAVYDNIRTETASTIGNVGVDLRWRLEFE